MVEGFGGACGICGYDRCNKALVFHHLDPSEKDFGFGETMANIKSWAKIAKELEKCVMLCSNCHMEHHAGIVDIPETAARFCHEDGEQE